MMKNTANAAGKESWLNRRRDMPKRYLNAEDKQDVLKLVTFYVNLNQMAETWSKLGKSKTLVKYLRMAKSLLDKICISITDELDEDAKKNLMAYSEKLQVKVVHTDQSKKEYQEMLKMDSVVPMAVDDLYELVEEVCGEYCRLLCTKKEDEVKECRARQIMGRYDVPVARIMGEGCPYKL